MHDTVRLLWYVLWVGVAAVAGTLLALLVSRLIRSRLQHSRPTETFTLQDLRQMRDRATITPEEYEAVRAALMGREVSGTGTPASGPARTRRVSGASSAKEDRGSPGADTAGGPERDRHPDV